MLTPTNLVKESIQTGTTRASIHVKQKRISSRVPFRLDEIVEEFHIAHTYVSVYIYIYKAS
jgi:hypothetical protein